MLSNDSAPQRLKRLKNSFTPVLAVVLASGIACIAAGSIKANRDLQRLQDNVAQSVSWQRLLAEIMHDREMLSLSVRTASKTGDLDWQGRYDAYERQMMAAIAQLETMTGKADSLSATRATVRETTANHASLDDIKAAVLALATVERSAFELIRQNDLPQALTILSSESYESSREVGVVQMQSKSDDFSQKIQLYTIHQDREWTQANLLIDAGIVLLTAAWCLLLSRIGYYGLCYQQAQRTAYQAQQQMAAQRQKVQGFEAALLKKQADLENTLSELQQTKDQLAVSHQDVQVSRAALSQKAVTLEEIVDELQLTKFKLAASHRDLQVSKAALSQKAATLETILEELQHAQMQMVQNEKMSSLGQLVAGIAHEVNNPINFIYANLEPMRDYASDLLDLVAEYQRVYPDPAPALRDKVAATDLDFVREDFPKVLTSMTVGSERIQQIVLSLQNFSRSDESGLKPANIHDGLESTLLILQHRLNERPGYSQIDLVCQYGDIPAVECFPGLINQVLMNLLSNAIDALDELCECRGDGVRGSITLRTAVLEKAGTEWVEIAIADTGIGIPEDIQGRIFDAFFTTKPVGKGTGMGLSISHTIVTKKHGGKLTFFSTAGEGSEFVVQLPVAVEAIAIEEPAFILQPPMASVAIRGQAAQFVL